MKETRYFIELGDIVALRFACRRCHTTISIALSQELRTDVLRFCPTCNGAWLMAPNGTTIEPAVKNYIQQLRAATEQLQRWSEHLNVADKEGVTLMLEISKEAGDCGE